VKRRRRLANRREKSDLAILKMRFALGMVLEGGESER